MILYHGTNVDFDEIEIKKTRNYKDFGQGFYLTDIKSQAEELATKRALMFGGTPIVQKYEFDEQLLESPDIKVLQFDSVCAEWAEFIYKTEAGRPHLSSTIMILSSVQSLTTALPTYLDDTKKVPIR